MGILQKLRYLLSVSQRKKLVILIGLLLVGMLFEMLGLGILIPALGLMFKPDIGKEYPALKPILETLGNPTQMQLVLSGMTILVLVYAFKTGYMIFLGWKQCKFTADLSSKLSQELFLGYLRQPYSMHLQRNSAELLNNIQSEITQFNSVAQSTISLTTEISIIVAVAVLLIAVEPVGALVVTSFLGFTAIGFHRLTKNRLLRWGASRQFHSAQINQHLLEGFGGVKDVKLLGRENYFSEEYAKNNVVFTALHVRVNTLALVPRPYLELLAVTGLAGLIILMLLQGKPLDLLLPTLGVFVAAAFRMIPSVNRIMSAMQAIRYANPVVDKLYRELKMVRDYHEFADPAIKMELTNEIQIDGLRYHYPNVTSFAVDGVSIVIKKGESIGFIGSSGSGKSTLVDIILGLLTPVHGSIFIDKQDIQTNLRSWQNQIGYVPQSIFLTDNSLRRNVAFGIPESKIDDMAVDRAIKAAQLDEFVKNLPAGLETFVGERGVRLSGGQRQRIGIARALYHDPGVLVLDEATSALDSVTEHSVMEAVTALQGKKTIIIVAHRLSTVEKCDRLYRIDSGKIVEEGFPKEMIKTRQVV